MSSISFINKKIGKTQFVWFKNSNMYLQLEETAWFIFSKMVVKYEPDKIAQQFSLEYGTSLKESLQLVFEIRDQADRFNQSSNEESRNFYTKYMGNHHPRLSKEHCYKLENTTIHFYYENEYYENFIHPLISVFEITGGEQTDTTFELFSYEKNVVVRVNGEVIGKWGLDQSHLVKGRIFIELINSMYNKSEKDWLMTVHASAITNGQKTMLFSAEPGSGKTTIAALLKTKGLRLIADDFVPVERGTFKAFPFPLAMSIKPGSMKILAPLFPGLEEKPLNYISDEKSVRYFPIELGQDFKRQAHPVTNFIIVQYDQSVDFELTHLSKPEAVKQLLNQAWIFPFEENVHSFFNWLEKTTFYKLTYSNTSRALDTIEKLFNDEKQ